MALIELPDLFLDRVNLKGDPPPTRDSSTIALTRDGERGIEVYLMRRQSTLEFAPGMYVFPGGSVHESDRSADIPWIGPTAEQWGKRLGCDADFARGIVVAAIRELFEEASVLLAGTPAEIVADAHSSEYESARVSLDKGELAMSDFLQSHQWSLRTDLIHPWSRWVTPEFESKRFDTRFFVAALPQVQEVGELSVESDHGIWMNVDDVIEGIDSESIKMLPPTRSTCKSLQGLKVADLPEISASRRMDPIMSKLVQVEGRWYLDVQETN